MDKKIKKTKKKQKILIVDDFEMNRAILSEMLGDEYEIMEAENGAEAIEVLQKHSVEISLMLLDIVMPVMDGYEVLALMNSSHLIDEVPVIMISAENSPSSINRAYDLGVMDFISRPFDTHIVRRRVKNIILLCAKQKKLEIMVADQIYEKQKTSGLMIAILSHIVEFRNGESGLHVLHVQTLTEILLQSLVKKTDKYKLTPAEIEMISTASALHDIGKIAIPDEILNKPGRLTNEEFAVMKTHSAIGAEMLKGLGTYHSEPLIQFAHDICRWHHERFDGRGYPDGLKGDEIPVAAQIVSLADVYDALTSERVYKKAFTHEKAMEMILNGECGTFNPLLLECLKDCEDEIKNETHVNSPIAKSAKDIKSISDKMANSDELPASEHIIRMLETERVKAEFTAETSKEVWFEYTAVPPVLAVSAYGAEKLGIERYTVDPLKDEKLYSMISEQDRENILNLLKGATPQEPIIEYNCKINLDGKPTEVKLICRTVWSADEKSQYSSILGKAEYYEN